MAVLIDDLGCEKAACVGAIELTGDPMANFMGDAFRVVKLANDVDVYPAG